MASDRIVTMSVGSDRIDVLSSDSDSDLDFSCRIGLSYASDRIAQHYTTVQGCGAGSGPG